MLDVLTTEFAAFGGITVFINGVVTVAIMRHEMRGLKGENASLRQANVDGLKNSDELKRRLEAIENEKVTALNQRITSIEQSRECELHGQRLNQFEKEMDDIKHATAGITAMAENVDTTRGNVAKIFEWLERDSKDLAKVGGKLDLLLKKEGLL